MTNHYGALSGFRALSSLIILVVAMTSSVAHANCEVGQFSEPVLATALGEPDAHTATLVAYGAVVAAKPASLDETKFGGIFLSELIPAALKSADGNLEAFKFGLALRLEGMCMAASANTAKPVLEKATDSATGLTSEDEKTALKNAVTSLKIGMNNIQTCAHVSSAASDTRCDDGLNPIPSGLKAPVDDSSTVMINFRTSCMFSSSGLSTNNKVGVLQSMQTCTEAAKDLHDLVKARYTSNSALQQTSDNLLSMYSTREAQLRAHAGAFLGSLNTINPDGSFDSGYQLLLTFDGNAIDTQTTPYICPHWLYWCRLSSEVDYTKQKFGSSDNAATFNPFKSSNGVLKIDEYYQARLTDNIGASFGGGFTAPVAPGNGSSDHIEPRFQFGLNYDTLFAGEDNKPTGFGQLFGGFARDQAWVTCARPGGSVDISTVAPCTDPKKAYGRYVIDGRYLIPGTTLGTFKVAARFYIDGPLDGQGDYQVRIGILAYKDINDWLSPPK